MYASYNISSEKIKIQAHLNHFLPAISYDNTQCSYFLTRLCPGVQVDGKHFLSPTVEE